MALYQPPSANLPVFDVLVFSEPNSAILTQEVADERYLARENVATSDATTTQFSGDVTASSFVGNYKTNNSVQNLTHYLNFSDSSSTGIGAIQKNVGLTFNPSIGPLSANGGLTIPTGPILGRNDTGANTFNGTLSTPTHPIGWTILATKTLTAGNTCWFTVRYR